jgi:hypothetical protein
MLKPRQGKPSGGKLDRRRFATLLVAALGAVAAAPAVGTLVGDRRDPGPRKPRWIGHC